MTTRNEALKAVKTIISYIGDDPKREGLLETPERFLRAWEKEWGKGYKENPKQFTKLFKEDSFIPDTMVLIKRINYFSHCEHHLTPHFGQVTIGYLPDNKGVIGLSKAARIVDHFSRRLSVQERLTHQIADFFNDHITKIGCGVIIKGTHLCMVTRGVMQPSSETITSALRGVFFTDSAARSEFLQLAE